MSQVPGRLVYTDSTGTEQVIGAFRPQDVSEGNISTFTVDEEARNYTRVIIEGGPSLQENMPTSLSEFQGSEPEIRAEKDPNGDGTWELRARVYPEESGTTNDRGHYKNKDLWGFKKYYGEDSVSTGTLTNTDITGAVDALLPSGYTAVYPSDITAPSISEYSYSGSRQQGFNELQREYDHFILFTTATDGNGNFIVRVQPTGYGGTERSFTRGQDAYTYNYWKRNDLSNVVSRVNVVGKDSTNSKVDLTFQAGSDTGDPDVDTYLTDLSNPDRNRFKRVHVDHPINSSDAEEIARGILDPTGTEHGEIEAGLDSTSNINNSIGLLDDSRNIDDVYTVVKQKDFFHQGVTLYSFEFERESTQDERDKWREHDSERAKVYPSTSKGLNGQTGSTAPGVSGDTGSTAPDVAGNTADTGPNVSNSTGAAGGASVISSTRSTKDVVSWSNTEEGNWKEFSEKISTPINDISGIYIFIRVFVDMDGYTTTDTSERVSIDWRIQEEDRSLDTEPGNDTVPTEVIITEDANGFPIADTCHVSMFLPYNYNNETLAIQAKPIWNTADLDSANIEIEFTAWTIDEHSHGSGTLAADLHPHSDGTLGTDNHPHADGTLGTDNHPHDTGTLEASTAEEDKTDR